jgi:hypothetical protein
MRVIPATFVGLVALANVSVQAAPNNANWVDLGAVPPLDLVAQSCGHEWLRTRSRDHWGYWHWGHWVPMDVTTTVQMRYGIRPKAGWPYRISYLA